jgi:hypothetical protein
MRVSVRFLSRSANAEHRAPPAVGAFPTPREVLDEIGLLLAIHLSAAFGVVMALRLFGIA